MMELHAPGGPVRSLKDFLVHIGVVTVGILIALGLEQMLEAHHRSQLAKTAVAGFRKELAYESQVTNVLGNTPVLHAKVDAAIALLPAPTADAANGAAQQKLDYPGFRVDIISTANWDTAVATQALNEMPFENGTHYAQAYGTLRLFGETERQTLGISQDLRRFGADPAALSKDQRTALMR